MKIEHSQIIPEVLLLTPKVFSDHRGFFMETHRISDFGDFAGAKIEFVQSNLSDSLPFTLRGLHYQLKKPQGKLVRVTRGLIYDVAVDLRRSSPTFGRWVGHWLDAANGQAVYVPPCFAHGFLTGPQGATVQYECTTYYVDEWNRSLSWKDDHLNIGWPIPSAQMPNISAKDRAAPGLAEVEVFEEPLDR